MFHCMMIKNNVIALFSDYKNATIKKVCIPFMHFLMLNIDYYGTKLSEILELIDKEKKLNI